MPKIIENKLKKIKEKIVNKLNIINISNISITKQK